MTTLTTSLGVATWHIQQNHQAWARALAQVSSGLRITTAADDPSGQAVAATLAAWLSGTQVAVRAASDMAGVLDTADGALGTVTDQLQRLRVLAVQAGDGAYAPGSPARSALATEASGLLAGIDQTLAAARWASTSLFAGQLGTNGVAATAPVPATAATLTGTPPAVDAIHPLVVSTPMTMTVTVTDPALTGGTSQQTLTLGAGSYTSLDQILAAVNASAPGGTIGFSLTGAGGTLSAGTAPATSPPSTSTSGQVQLVSTDTGASVALGAAGDLATWLGVAGTASGTDSVPGAPAVPPSVVALALPLVDGAGNLTTVSIDPLSVQRLGLSGYDPSAGTDPVDAALATVNQLRTRLGAQANMVRAEQDRLTGAALAGAGSLSTVRDEDLAAGLMALTGWAARQKVAMSVWSLAAQADRDSITRLYSALPARSWPGQNAPLDRSRLA